MHIWPGKDLFELWAIYKPFKEESYRKRIAVFFSRESALKYIHKSSLKHPSREAAFKKSSLLRHAASADIVLCEAVEIEPKL